MESVTPCQYKSIKNRTRCCGAIILIRKKWYTVEGRSDIKPNDTAGVWGHTPPPGAGQK